MERAHKLKQRANWLMLLVAARYTLFSVLSSVSPNGPLPSCIMKECSNIWTVSREPEHMSYYDLSHQLDHCSHQSLCEVVDSLQAIAEYHLKDEILRSLSFTEFVSNTHYWSKKGQKQRTWIGHDRRAESMSQPWDPP